MATLNVYLNADDLQVLEFGTLAAFARWLAGNHDKQPDGIWLRSYKKSTGKQSFTHDDVLEIALCYGWIDGIGKSEGAESTRQRWLPRRRRSTWSKRNTDLAARLIAEGRMQPSGLAEVDRAKADGRWAAAYDPPSSAKPPPEFLALLAKNPKAKALYETLDSRNRYAILHRLMTAKRAETRERGMRAFVDMLERGEKIY